MQKIHRRSFVQLALAAVPSAMLGQITTAQPSSNIDNVSQVAAQAAKVAEVPAGTDREEKKRVVGVSSTTYKVMTAETAGAMFVMEQLNHKKGGPPRHLHHGQDELFYVMEGEYIVEVGGDRFHLKAGDCVLGPREIPHAWAFVGDGAGRMLLSYAPAGKMEAFFNGREAAGIKPGAYTSTAGDVARMREHGMEPMGPAIAVD